MGEKGSVVSRDSMNDCAGTEPESWWARRRIRPSGAARRGGRGEGRDAGPDSGGGTYLVPTHQGVDGSSPSIGYSPTCCTLPVYAAAPGSLPGYSSGGSSPAGYSPTGKSLIPCRNEMTPGSSR